MGADQIRLGEVLSMSPVGGSGMIIDRGLAVASLRLTVKSPARDRIDRLSDAADPLFRIHVVYHNARMPALLHQPSRPPSTAFSSCSRLAISTSMIDPHIQAAYLTFSDARTSGIPLPHLSPTSTLRCLQTSCIYNAFASRKSTPTPSTPRGPTLPTS